MAETREALCAVNGNRLEVNAQGDALESPVWRLTQDDALTMRDCLSHVLVLGASGSGKSSSVMAHMTRAYLREFTGGLILTANPGDRQAIEKAAQGAGRLDQLVVIGPESDFIFNPLHSELTSSNRGGGMISKLVELIMVAQELSSNHSKSQGASDDFWPQQQRRFLAHLFRLDALANGSISLANLVRYLQDAPRSPEEVQDPTWQEHSFVDKSLAKAFKRSAHKQSELQDVGNFFLKEFPRMADKTRESVIAGVVGMLQPLLEEPLKRYFTRPANIHPSDTWRHGMFLCIDYPVAQYGLAGTLLQGMALYAFQKGVEGRDLQEEAGNVCIIADEYQCFFSDYSSTFQAYARGKGCATLYATQSRAAFADRRGGGPSAADTVDAFFANFGTLFCLAVDQATAKFVADQIGEKYGFVSNVGGSHGQQKGQLFAGASEQKKYLIEPQELTSQLRGGPPHFYARCVAYRNGQTWSNGKSYLRLKIPQARQQ